MPLELSGKEVWTWSSEYERLTPNERRIGSLQSEIPYGAMSMSTQWESRTKNASRGLSLWVEVPDPWTNTIRGHWQEEGCSTKTLPPV